MAVLGRVIRYNILCVRILYCRILNHYVLDKQSKDPILYTIFYDL